MDCFKEKSTGCHGFFTSNMGCSCKFSHFHVYEHLESNDVTSYGKHSLGLLGTSFAIVRSFPCLFPIIHLSILISFINMILHDSAIWYHHLYAHSPSYSQLRMVVEHRVTPKSRGLELHVFSHPWERFSVFLHKTEGFCACNRSNVASWFVAKSVREMKNDLPDPRVRVDCHHAGPSQCPPVPWWFNAI